ncbi:MAG: prolipoprotein diacylglyceryl transferase [Myxococcales bacterium]|nr:prolipoprotein diacylglyceryl transferase [Myxococcales bacterium]
MHPTVFRWDSGWSWLGTIEISAYFVCVAAGMVVGTWLLWRWARRRNLDRDDILDLALWIAVAGVVGAKLMHVLVDGYLMEYVHICTDPSQVFWDSWRVGSGYCRELHGIPQYDELRRYVGCVPTERNCFAWINLFAGGYTYYGGLIGGGLAAFVLIRRRRLPLWPTVDTLSWIVVLGVAFGRLGCFLNGCCFGEVTDSCLGVTFPAGSPAWIEHGQQGLIGPGDRPLPVLPTQLFEAAACVAIAAFLALWVERRKRYEGETFVAGIALYAAARIGIEFFRADPRGGALGLSTSQIVGLVALAAMAVLHFRLSRRPASSPVAAPPPGGAPPPAGPPPGDVPPGDAAGASPGSSRPV